MRPIDADAIPYTMLYKENWIEGTGREERGAWKSDIDKLPTIEPKRGHWEVVDYEEPRRYGCSECKRLVWHTENYCPNCGADMRGGQE